jgi:hypothetical protein
MPQKKGNAPKKDVQIGKKENSQTHEEQRRGDTTMQETPS